MKTLGIILSYLFIGGIFGAALYGFVEKPRVITHHHASTTCSPYTDIDGEWVPLYVVENERRMR